MTLEDILLPLSGKYQEFLEIFRNEMHVQDFGTGETVGMPAESVMEMLRLKWSESLNARRQEEPSQESSEDMNADNFSNPCDRLRAQKIPNGFFLQSSKILNCHSTSRRRGIQVSENMAERFLLGGLKPVWLIEGLQELGERLMKSVYVVGMPDNSGSSQTFVKKNKSSHNLNFNLSALREYCDYFKKEFSPNSTGTSQSESPTLSFPHLLNFLLLTLRERTSSLHWARNKLIVMERLKNFKKYWLQLRPTASGIIRVGPLNEAVNNRLLELELRQGATSLRAMCARHYGSVSNFKSIIDSDSTDTDTLFRLFAIMSKTLGGFYDQSVEDQFRLHFRLNSDSYHRIYNSNIVNSPYDCDCQTCKLVQSYYRDEPWMFLQYPRRSLEFDEEVIEGMQI